MYVFVSNHQVPEKQMVYMNFTQSMSTKNLSPQVQFQCQKPIIMCFVLPHQCFQTGISDWHFLSEDKSDENFLSENTSVIKSCQKIQIKLCQRCFLSPPSFDYIFQLKNCVYDILTILVESYVCIQNWARDPGVSRLLVHKFQFVRSDS